MFVGIFWNHTMTHYMFERLQTTQECDTTRTKDWRTKTVWKKILQMRLQYPNLISGISAANNITWSRYTHTNITCWKIVPQCLPKPGGSYESKKHEMQAKGAWDKDINDWWVGLETTLSLWTSLPLLMNQTASMLIKKIFYQCVVQVPNNTELPSQSGLVSFICYHTCW